MLQGAVVYLINRIFSKLRFKPEFRLVLFFKVLSPPPFYGVLFASLPIAVGCFFVWFWWHGLSSDDPILQPSILAFEDIAGDWLDTMVLDPIRVAKYKEGRIGTSFVAMGLYLVILGTKLMIPDNMDQQQEDNAHREMEAVPLDPYEMKYEEKEEVEENEFWAPLLWKRAHLMLVSLVLVCILIWVWEFSYSELFAQNVYEFIVIFKILYRPLLAKN